MRRLLLILSCLPVVVALDEAVIADPQSVTFRDRRAEQHWNALFEAHPTHALRHLVALSLHAPDRYNSLLAARLLYRGAPWTRRGDESGVTASEWRRRCQPVLVAALRELRLRDDPALQRVSIALLGLDGDPELSIAALVDLLARDAAVAKAGALRVAIPDHPEALPAARVDEARRLARGLLVEHWGIADPEIRPALVAGLERGSPRERNAVLALIGRGEADDLVAPTLRRIIAACQTATPTTADLDGLALACDRLLAVRDDALREDLIALAISGRRETLSAACSLLARGDDAPLPAADFIAAALADTDLHRRHARFRLLVRRAPAALAEHAAIDPAWRQLAAHRTRLSRWNTDE